MRTPSLRDWSLQGTFLRKHEDKLINMKKLLLLSISMILIVTLSGCARKKNNQSGDALLPVTLKTDYTVLGQTIASGQTLSATDQGNPIEVTIGSPYTSAIGEKCFEAKVYYQNGVQSIPQPRAVCNRNDVWALLPEILMPVPNYNSGK